MDAAEKEAFAEGLSTMIESVPREELGPVIAEFGWLDLLEEAPAEAVEIVFPLIGRHLVALPLLDDVVVRAAGLEPGPGTAVVYPSLSASIPTSVAKTVGAGYDVELTGMVLARDAAPDTVVVPVLLDGRPTILTGPWDQSWPRAGRGMDAAGGWARLTAHWSVAAVPEHSAGEQAWTGFRAAGHRALAHEMTAMGTRMLELAVEHTTSREQFGQRLSSFQVVRHKLADVRVWQETALLAAEAAQETADPQAALLAKTMAGRFLETARLHCQQLLGGMGFTNEHPFHEYLRRALVLEVLLGSTRALRSELGTTLAAEESMPRLVTL